MFSNSRARLLVGLLIVPVVAFSASCFRAERPRSIGDIRREMSTLDTLYLTEDGQEVIAPGSDREIIVDPATGKLASQALQCENPNCPKRQADGSPYVFALLDPFAYVDGAEVRVRQPKTPEEQRQVQEFFDRKRMCPACLEIRDLNGETDEQKQKYQSYVRYHVLPESARRLKALNEEYREYVKREQERKSQ